MILNDSNAWKFVAKKCQQKNLTQIWECYQRSKVHIKYSYFWLFLLVFDSSLEIERKSLLGYDSKKTQI